MAAKQLQLIHPPPQIPRLPHQLLIFMLLHLQLPLPFHAQQLHLDGYPLSFSRYVCYSYSSVADVGNAVYSPPWLFDCVCLAGVEEVGELGARDVEDDFGWFVAIGVLVTEEHLEFLAVLSAALRGCFDDGGVVLGFDFGFERGGLHFFICFGFRFE